MEDPGEECEIEECFTSGEEPIQSKLSWILSKGLCFGKKVMITGFVVSSAPVVLPPLVVVSALGFAVSVPFGVVFASYTCTEKLMSKLLPMPQPSETLDYGPPVIDKAEEDGIQEGEFAVEEEDKKQIQDTKQEVEMRIELADDDKKEQEKGTELADDDKKEHPNRLNDSAMVVQEKSYSDEAFKEKGYEEDDGEYLEGNDEGSLGGTNVKIEGRGEDSVEESLIKETKDETPQPVVKQIAVEVEQEKKSAHGVKKTREVVVVGRPVQGETESAVGGSEEAEVLKKESTGLLEKIKGEGDTGESAQKNKKKSKHRLKKALGLGGKKEDENATKEREKNSEIRHQNLNQVVAGSDRPNARQAVQITSEGENRNIQVTVDNRENSQVADKHVGSPSISINGNRSGEQPNLVINKGVDPMVENKQTIQGLEMDNAVVSSGHENVQVESNVIHRETAGNGVPSKVEAAIASTENSLSEKNLWEQIRAMRLIVGYKAAPQSSFTEELKALYVFTGIEPPSSFEDSANIGDAEDKLRFLMSIVGVK